MPAEELEAFVAEVGAGGRGVRDVRLQADVGVSGLA
jgi:hypothetical protein